ncbi:MAG: cysteine--tRNA ligase [Deltaproteobacteria bacterium]|nr:cysteine--tRNA ligase [Deltaproteobacteria bacterium]
MKNTILDYIGNTPLIEINHLNTNKNVKIFAKLEYFNPGGSIKDRIALSMIEDGEKSGKLTKDKIVIEATSGNTGIGIAMICAVKGYKLILAMSEAVSLERQKILKARGAEIILTPSNLGTDGAIEEVYKIYRENPEKYFMTDQYNNSANWKSHYDTTAKEIWNQTEGTVTKFVATLGTTGTVIGTSKGLKDLNDDIEIVAVEPFLGHKIQGLKNLKEAYKPEIFDKQCIDKKINIEDEEAFEMARMLSKKEGLFVGMSSGAAMVAALKEAENMDSGVIVTIFADSGERYLSTTLFASQKKNDLKLFNTLARKKETFSPIIPDNVSIYSCGPTVHKRMHIGECRRFIFSDLLCRYFEYKNYSVTHVINITDLDDKTIEESERIGSDLESFTKENIQFFKDDLSFLRIKPASSYPKVSEHIDEMVLLTENLVDKGYAYEKHRSVYFKVSSFKDYGKLSGVDIRKIKIGATVDLDDYEKDNPRDFTLLKKTRLSELKRGIFTKTKWGNVRPSLHLQCAAISMKYLGQNFDIHTSSRELTFPHHENEIAIAKSATNSNFSKYWVHCDRVLVDGKKIDEKDNRITIDDLTNLGYSWRDIRFWFLSAHYRKPLTYSEERLQESQRFLQKIDHCIHSLMNITDGKQSDDVNIIIKELEDDFNAAMDDDLNISVAIASILKTIKKLNVFLSKKKIDKFGAEKTIDAFRSIDSVLNIFDFESKYSDPAVQYLLEERKKARDEMNWNKSDKIRKQLEDYGIHIRDKKS